MTDTLKPENADQLFDALQWAAAEGQSFDVRGHGSKLDFGRPMQAALGLDLSGLNAITAYEPSELYMTALAATPIADIKAALRQNNQQMAFEPPDMGMLYGGEQGGGSIGGAIACNLAGPRRVQVGAARDHFLGFHAVSGRGEVFKSGGTVVKNVTGFDLSKLLAGSFGTLAVMSHVTFKVMPAAEKTRTVLVPGLSDDQAMNAMAAAMGSSNDVSGAAHLPASAAARSGVSYVSGAGVAVTALRVEGPGPSVEHRCRALTALLNEFGEIEELHSKNSADLWQEIGDAGVFMEGDAAAGDSGTDQIWRLSVPPMDGAGVVERILGETGAETGGRVFYDWGGGLVWLGLKASPDASHEVVRGAVKPTGGLATLIRADAGVRRRVPVFEPQPGALGDLAKRVKGGFDPNGVLNPGRMVEGV
ncbi:MAG: FAD-binding protein [Alphaproteobacteria bacterium]|nr:FAD-binding protein [Alphaproteobacteria bacterium]